MKCFSFFLLRFCFVVSLFLGMRGGVIGQVDTVKYSLVDTTEARKLLDEAKGLITFQKFEDGLYKALKAKEIYEAVLGSENLEIAECWNRVGAVYLQTGRMAEAKAVWDLALKIRISVAGQESLEVGKSYANIGIYYREVGNFDQALDYMQKGLGLQLKFLPKEHSLIASSYNNLGAVYLSKGNFGQAIRYFQKALLLFIKILSDNNPQVANIYNNLGGVCQLKGDYDLAIEYYNKAYGIFVKLVGEDNVLVANPLSNISTAFLSKGEYDASIGVLEKVLDLRTKALGEKHQDVAQTYVNLASAWFFKNEPQHAIECYEKALGLYGKLTEVKISDIASAHNNLGLTFHLIGDYDSAIEQNQNAINLYFKSVGANHPNIASAWYHIGKSYQQMNEFDKASQAIFSALKALQYDQKNTLDNVNSIPYLIKCLANMASLYVDWFTSGQCAECIDLSYQYYNQSLTVLTYQSNTISPASKSTLAAEAKEIYAGATTTNLLLHALTDSIYYLHESFDFAEHSKAMILYEAMQETNALAVSGIPDSLLQQEYDLRVDIAYYDKKRQEKLAASLSDTDSTVLEIGSKLFDLNRQYETLKSHIETNYPQYYKAKYDLSTISLQEVQGELLQPNQSLLEYLVGDSSIFAFLVRKDTFIAKEIKHDFPLEQWVKDMTKDGIYGYYSDPTKNKGRNPECTANYTRAASLLYDKLVAPIAEHLTEQMIIVPDGALGYLPFEALLTQKPAREGAFSSYPFMLKERQISYCYSATLLREMRQKQHRQAPTGEVLAMAPFFHGNVQELVSRIDTMDLLALRDTLGPLRASGEETAIVAKLLRGETMYGGQASLQQFREAAGSHRILHLSTHGKADDRVGDYAYLAFGVPGDSTAYDKLYARDLYNYSLNADMVVLSACETGIGKLRKGEGIVSLSRAFAYAGAKSIFPTLWQVSDARTAELMRYFYQNLKIGKGKDEALSAAKLKYLDNHKGEDNHPFYWAGMIGVGDMSPISR